MGGINGCILLLNELLIVATHVPDNHGQSPFICTQCSMLSFSVPSVSMLSGSIIIKVNKKDF